MNDKKYCTGCGIELQDENMLLEGYTADIENDLCSRCFRMKNYGDYQVVAKSNDEYIEILKSVNETKDLVLYMIDLLNIERDINEIRKYISNRVIMILNKRDTLPRSVNDDKVKEYFRKSGFVYEDLIVVSPYKNYNMDELLASIKRNKSSKNVYIVGRTNVGKSTLINKLMQNYSDNDCDLTISPMPSTTLNKISIKLSDDLTLIDTPGLVDRGNIVNYVDSDTLKKISPRKEIKPKTYQLKEGQSLVIGGLLRIDYVEGDKNSFTVFVSNDLKIKRYNTRKLTLLNDLFKTTYNVGYYQDLVINGLGFIKIVEKANIDVYLDKNIEAFIRSSLI